MRSTTVLATSQGGDQVILLGAGRLALAFGPVILPLTRKRLVQLSEALAAIAADFERYSREDLVYVNCDQLVLRFNRQELLEVMSLVIAGLDGLQQQELHELEEAGPAVRKLIRQEQEGSGG